MKSDRFRKIDMKLRAMIRRRNARRTDDQGNHEAWVRVSDNVVRRQRKC